MNQSEFAALRRARWKTVTKWKKSAQLGFGGNDVSDESCKRWSAVAGPADIRLLP